MNNLNLVSINNNQVVVSSRQVAENFKKRHCDVLESINEILKTENSVLRFFSTNQHIRYKAITNLTKNT